MKAGERVFLVGLMGCGKSTVGRALSRRLGWKHVDTDAWIEKKAGRSIGAIFDGQGEAAFRRLERQALDFALRQKKCVVSVGGGMVADAANRRRLYKGGRSAYLRLSAQRALARLDGRGLAGRPLLKGPRPLAALRSLLKQRRGWYAHAEITVSALGKPEAVAERVARRLLL
jgi:shikimate kinase